MGSLSRAGSLSLALRPPQAARGPGPGCGLSRTLPGQGWPHRRLALATLNAAPAPGGGPGLRAVTVTVAEPHLIGVRPGWVAAAAAARPATDARAALAAFQAASHGAIYCYSQEPARLSHRRWVLFPA